MLSHLSKTLDHANDIIAKYNIQDPTLSLAIRIASAFHDIGKADYRFQKYLIENKPVVYHPLLGLSVVSSICHQLEENLKSLIIFAVASHHTALHQDLYSETNDDQMLEVIDRDHFKKIVYNLAQQIGIALGNIDECFSTSASIPCLELDTTLKLTRTKKEFVCGNLLLKFRVY